ncbi:GGDEF domain-containing protein, partial [Oleiphilus sp. HI0086]
NYDQAIEIGTHDELLTVARAMEHMRLSIKEREERLELMSQIDGLTQLYNRPFFDQAMDISLANSRRNMTPLTLVMMDIDHFKKVNDTYGHQAGDECLKLIARLMKKQYQRQTDIVARYGGEEFIAILYGQTQEEALLQTEKLRRAIEDANMTYQGKTIPMTASFGLASMAPPEWQKGESLVGFADSALYQAKESGRNRICIGGQSGGHETQNTA